jgi:hypothetical protein
MRTREIKALNETIASVVNPMDADRAKALQEGYLNSLTEKARQICEETIEEKAAPGMEDWASDPKVKASFKKQYGKRWKEVMYARSWNLAKKEKELGVNEEAELDLAEGVSAKRMRIIRKHLLSGKPIKGEVADFMQRSFKKQFYKNKEKFGGETPAVLGRAALKHSAMKAKGLAEAEQLDEISQKLKDRYAMKRGEQLHRSLYSYRTDKPTFTGKKQARIVKGLRRAMGKDVSESVQLDEAGYKKLMRLKKAAYEKKNPKVARAAAEQESKVAARMAMKGGASAEAVKGGGSLIGKSGKYTQKAGNLANQRSKAIASFRNLNVDRGVARDTGSGSVEAMANRLQGKKPKMTKSQISKKRGDQAAMRDFRNRARSGDFGQNNQEGMRPRYNYLKRTGQLKTK